MVTAYSTDETRQKGLNESNEEILKCHSVVGVLPDSGSRVAESRRTYLQS